MCGISGIFTFNNNKMPELDIRAMSTAMRHRGPDSEGYAFFYKEQGDIIIAGGEDTSEEVYTSAHHYTPKKAVNAGMLTGANLALVHRRLAILDVSAAGHQPMNTEDGRYWIIHNGEVYNFKALRKELIQHGEKFVSQTDTEVILKAYRFWGNKCLEKFNGMWAFVIWDSLEQKLFCARDRIGIKPFYFYHTQDFFAFASEVDTLIAAGIYTPKENWEGIYHSLSLYCAPRPMTCFQDIFALPQGHWMTIDKKGHKIQQKYWQVSLGNSIQGKSEQYWIDQLDETLTRSIKRRLLADVPVGTFMSGGIDSTTVSAIAAQNHPDISALTLAFPGLSELDELPQAQETAKMYPINHIIQQTQPEIVIENINDIIRCYGEPFPTLGPTYILSELAKKNETTVVLNGLGPDELFCGYNRERWLKARQIFSGKLPALNFYPFTSGRLNKLYEVIGSKTIEDYYVRMFSAFSEQEKKALFLDKQSSHWNTSDVIHQAHSRQTQQCSDDIEAINYLELSIYIGDHHMFRGDRFTMNSSIESRYPFLDHEMVELAFKMPSSIKLKNGTGKYVLRQLAKKYIHPSCLSMQKKGFSLPLDQWMRNNLKTFVDEKLLLLANRGIFSKTALDYHKNRFEQAKDSPVKLWLLVSIELWLETYIDKKL